MTPRRDGHETPWIEKFRPKTLDELGLPIDQRALAQAWLDGATLPHLLLHGPPGTGKTTLVRILAAESNLSVLDLDGSRERGIDIIRGKVLGFARGLGITGRLKIVFIDEADQLTLDAQAALHHMMDEHMKTTRFVFTCNHISKIDKAIRSRCQILEFKGLPTADRANVLSRILTKEGHSDSPTTTHLFASRFTDLRKMIQAAETSITLQGELVPPPAPAGSPRLVGEILDDPNYTAEIPWDLEPYTAAGRLTLIAGPPKLAGKSTFARHYAAAKATGGRFLGQELQAAPVLWIGPDESEHDTARCFAQLAPKEMLVHVWGMSPDIEAIAEMADRIGAGLVVLDTLPRIARVGSENDNAMWTAWSERALTLIHRSGAVWLAIHHHRKAGGSGGNSIRGGSAIFGFVDVAVSLLPIRHASSSRRLVVEGSRLGAPGSRLITLTPEGYVDRGEYADDADGAEMLSDRQQMVLDVLGDRSLTIDELFAELSHEGADFSDQTLRGDLDEFASRGLVQRTGRGVRGQPFRYSRVK